MERAQRMLSHVSPSLDGAGMTGVLQAEATHAAGPAQHGVGQKNPRDVVIVSALRTAIGKAKRGVFKDTPVEELLAAVLKATLDKTRIDPLTVGDIVVGTVLGEGSQKANQCRMAAFLAGFPEEVTIQTVNRQCSSGLQALAVVASSIKAGFYDVGIAAGLESMSAASFSWKGGVSERVLNDEKASACLMPMGITSENVAERYGITREQQDQMAAMSHERAAAAIKSGAFRQEIVPVQTKWTNPKTNEEKSITVDTDEGVRPGTTPQQLAKLKPAFKEGGSTTAGNASQVSDGAAAVLAMTRETANRLGLPIMGVFRTYAVTGVDPAVMGIGPAVAIPAAVSKAGLSVGDIDLFEINEAFASQATYSVQKLGIPWNKVNVNGGAVALGHPLGCTGARQVATLLHEMHRRRNRFGVISMCIGSGMGAAGVFEVEL